MGSLVSRVQDIFSGSPYDIVVRLLSMVIALTLAFSVHELMHGFIAYKMGDPTAKNQGRLSLNPLHHMDPIGTISIVLFGFGWAKPVPINPGYFKNPKRGMAITALAGPVSNILMGLITALLRACWIVFGMGKINQGIFIAVLTMLEYTLAYNVGLAIFNLIPIPPLDGSKVLFAFLPNKVYYKLMQYEQYGFILLILLLFIGLLDRPLMFLSNGIYSMYDAVIGLIFH